MGSGSNRGQCHVEYRVELLSVRPFVCFSVHPYIHMCVCVYIHMNIYTYIRMSAHLSVYTYVHTYICMSPPGRAQAAQSQDQAAQRLV